MEEKQVLTKEKLINKVSFLDNEDMIAAKLYFHYNDGNQDVILKAPTNNNSVDNKIAKIYTDSVLSKFKSERTFQVLDITEVEEFDSTATHYYYEKNYPEELQVLFSKSNESFSFKKHDYKNIKGFLIDLAYGKDSITLYKYRHNFDIHIKPSLLTLVRIDNELLSPSDESIIINDKFEYVISDQYLIAMNISTLERKIKFDERVKKRSKDIIESLKTAPVHIVEGFDKLEEFLSSEFNFAKKMQNINYESLLWKTPFSQIRDKIKEKPQIGKYLKFNKAETKFNITSKQAAKIFFKLCNDKVMESIISGNIHLADELESIE